MVQRIVLDKSHRQYVVKALSFSMGDAEDEVSYVEGGKEGRKEGRIAGRKEGRTRGDLQEEGSRTTRGRGRRGGLSKFRLNSPRINIRNGALGCHKLACCPLLSFLDSTICIGRYLAP